MCSLTHWTSSNKLNAALMLHICDTPPFLYIADNYYHNYWMQLYKQQSPRPCELTYSYWSHKSTRSMKQSNDTSWLVTVTTFSQNSRLWYLSTSKNDVTTTRLANLRPARLCCAFWLSSMSLNSTNIYKVDTYEKQMHCTNTLQHNRMSDSSL